MGSTKPAPSPIKAQPAPHPRFRSSDLGRKDGIRSLYGGCGRQGQAIAQGHHLSWPVGDPLQVSRSPPGLMAWGKGRPCKPRRNPGLCRGCAIIPACYPCSLPPISPSVSNMSVQKILAWEDLLAQRDRLRQENKRTVFTNGCFDLLHPGHIDYLSRARQMGDALIVGVNSDRSVRELKGPLRPILTQDERARLLSGLDSVDYITVFDEDTPHRLITALLPTCWSRGATGRWIPSWDGRRWRRPAAGWFPCLTWKVNPPPPS